MTAGPTTVAFVVAKGKKELRRVTARVENGEVVGADGDEPDITFTMTENDAQALHDGDLELSVGFMRGQIKMAGDFGKLLAFLPLTHGDNPPVAVTKLL
jgi:putative sterol carrier protein